MGRRSCPRAPQPPHQPGLFFVLIGFPSASPYAAFRGSFRIALTQSGIVVSETEPVRNERMDCRSVDSVRRAMSVSCARKRQRRLLLGLIQIQKRPPGRRWPWSVARSLPCRNKRLLSSRRPPSKEAARTALKLAAREIEAFDDSNRYRRKSEKGGNLFEGQRNSATFAAIR